MSLTVSNVRYLQLLCQRNPHFHGRVEEARANQSYLSQNLESDLYSLSRFLQSVAMNAGVKSFTYFEVLQALDEHRQKNSSDLTVGQCREFFFPRQFKELGEKRLSNALSQLSAKGLIQIQASYYYNDLYVSITPKGNSLPKIANNAPRRSKDPKEDFPQTKPSVNVAKPILPNNDKLKIHRLRALLAPHKSGITGWDLLKMLIQGKTLPGKNAKALQEQFKSLGELGFLTPNPKPNQSALWLSTPEAKEMLRIGNPLDACEVTSPDIQQFLESEITNLEAEKVEKRQHIQTLETRLDELTAAVDQVREQWSEQRNIALSAYDKAKEATSRVEQELLKNDAADELLKTELLEQEIKAKTELSNRAKVQLEDAKAFYLRWSRQASHTIKTLHQAVLKIRSDQFQNHNTALVKQLQDLHDRATVSDSNTVAIFSTILGSLERYHQLTDEEANNLEQQADASVSKAAVERELEERFQLLRSQN